MDLSTAGRDNQIATWAENIGGLARVTISTLPTDITFDFLLQLYRIAKKYEVDDLAILAADHFVQKLTTVQLSEVGNIVQSLLGEGGNLGEYLAAFMMREHNRLMQQPSFVSMLANHWPFLFQLMHNMGHWVLDVRSLPIEEDDAEYTEYSSDDDYAGDDPESLPDTAGMQIDRLPRAYSETRAVQESNDGGSIDTCTRGRALTGGKGHALIGGKARFLSGGKAPRSDPHTEDRMSREYPNPPAAQDTNRRGYVGNGTGGYASRKTKATPSDNKGSNGGVGVATPIRRHPGRRQRPRTPHLAPYTRRIPVEEAVDRSMDAQSSLIETTAQLAAARTRCECCTQGALGSGLSLTNGR
ncbi:hypothetical protein M438DRAFT_332897 [Aureobasidium pullulans EXF-150]|uniref:Uncharacterized protein n=1 Tax=Aureobasidium pullulans EXF-150 TaxID=1043002 RepID=A0A074YJN5_AURPU|nr:uncharacterized protein M438DRAFT_332897 [Aureobasidium pullulans EXF-150]KEQ87091.1 hypothetical protein M438DRAFT_332897 [Aureobasidium pullulans EXF-150]